MSHKQQIYDKEKVQFNLVKYQKFGKTFELVVDPDLAISFKGKSKKDVDSLIELLRAEKIFSDAKKGEIASPEDLLEVFNTDKFLDIAMIMLEEGEIQLTSEHREKLRQEKKQKIVHLIHRAAINPQTGTPHPVIRIENAMLEAKIKIDEFKRAEDQVNDVLTKLKPIIPIKIEELVLNIKLGMNYASRLHGVLTGYGKIENEVWAGDSFFCKLKIPAGIQEELFDELNSKTHGTAQIELEKKR